jgi:hypothetical protein
MKSILDSSATSLIPACYIGRPVPANGPEEPPAVQPVTNFPDIGEVSGDQKPDWSEYDEKYGTSDPGPQPDIVPPSPDPNKGETRQPEKPEKQPEKGPSGPTGPKTDQTGQNRGPDGKFLPSGESGPSGPAAPAAPAATKPAGPSGPSGPAAPAAFDPDAALKKLDSIQIKADASQRTRDGFKEIKEITKTALAKNKEYLTKISELERAPKKDPAIDAELADLREFKASFEAQNDPKLVEAYKTKLDETENKIIEVLTTDEDLMMPADQAARLKAVGFDSPQGRNMINGILNAVAQTGDHLLLDRVKDMFRGRKQVVEDHDKQMTEIKERAGKYWEGKQQAEEQEMRAWSGEADKKLINLFEQPGYEWGHFKKIEEGMDEASKAEAEKHNTHLRDVIVPEIRKGIAAVYSRDPAAMEYVAKAHAVDHANRQVAAMQAELDQAKQRIAELEDTARGVQRISDPTREDNTPTGDGKIAPSTMDMTAEQAADAYMEQKYGGGHR